MDFFYDRQCIEEGDIVVVDCDHQCNVKVMDDHNFQAYRSLRGHTYYGGFYRSLPARIVVPYSGHWNVTLDLGGGTANVRYGFSYIKRHG